MCSERIGELGQRYMHGRKHVLINIYSRSCTPKKLYSDVGNALRKIDQCALL